MCLLLLLLLLALNFPVIPVESAPLWLFSLTERFRSTFPKLILVSVDLLPGILTRITVVYFTWLQS